MTRKKAVALGLAALVLTATAVAVTTGAQAEPTANFEFTCLENDKTNVNCTAFGEAAFYHSSETDKEHKFAAGFASVFCTGAESKMTTDADGKVLIPQVEPQYKNCSAFPGNLTTHISTNGCEYYFFIEKERSPGDTEEEYEGSATIHCPSEKSITIEVTEKEVPRCIVHVPPQTTIKPIYFRNMKGSSPTDVTVEAFETKASAQFTAFGGSLLARCGVISENSSIKYYGNSTVRATNAAGTVIDAQIK